MRPLGFSLLTREWDHDVRPGDAEGAEKAMGVMYGAEKEACATTHGTATVCKEVGVGDSVPGGVCWGPMNSSAGISVTLTGPAVYTGGTAEEASARSARLERVTEKSARECKWVWARGIKQWSPTVVVSLLVGMCVCVGVGG
ncbi:hypothetical protein TraAM80_06227 [Trypanosoma rangeli]|uniref:Uncharacterized protein n=1 Tax=Trypanosoma rangeli TaxID=5698 RepID=A0A3R7KWH8_TRYRA|nr:uncharacterized protein TraAM80_06227 [Trypanosoma rangeli]RNF02776.1 hypothetical protein TraAM80_06227 [Trypanosoma rangeli]|eukprot:RNF02776.1 hypothetical protein TraAM80_06227 [Trypanosoma rangeli]